MHSGSVPVSESQSNFDFEPDFDFFLRLSCQGHMRSSCLPPLPFDRPGTPLTEKHWTGIDSLIYLRPMYYETEPTPDPRLEREILHGLSCEWDNAVWYLDGDLRAALKKPLFALDDARRRWGMWRGDRRIISLSRRLVHHHPWDAVRDVLFHEMAHQLAEEGLGAGHEPPHGPVFRRACALLRANPDASGRFPTLRQRMARAGENNGDRVLRRITKLMALSESANRHEAEAAMVKARELMARHHLAQLPRNRPGDFFSVFLGHPALRHFREVYHLAGILTDFYFVQGIWVPAYVLGKGKMGKVLEISGTRTNVEIAAYVHGFVEGFIHTRWQRYNREKGLNRYRKTDFAVGILQGFRSKLELRTTPPPGPGGPRDLTRIDDPVLTAYMAHRYPRTTRFSRQANRIDRNVYDDGVRVGKKLVVSKAVTETGTGCGKMLSGPAPKG
jgi:Protein of unknown function (DUF2786)/SprT-like family